MNPAARRWTPITVVVVGVLAAAVGWVAGASSATDELEPLAEYDPARVAAAAERDGTTERLAPTPAHAVDPSEAARLAAEPLRGHFGPIVRDPGRTATLDVQLSVDGLPCVATLEILAGADAGRVLHTDTDGQAGADDLYPGLVLVAIETARGERLRRELLLRHHRTTEWALDLGNYGTVSGRVVDAQGAPLAGAELELDGGFARSDLDGRFVIARRASDTPVLVARLDGHASRRVAAQPLGAASGADLVVRMEPAAQLVLSVPPRAELTGEVTLLLATSGEAPVLLGGAVGGSYPWSEVLPLTVPVGGELVLDDLPSCQVDVLAFHDRARGKPASGWCRPGTPVELEIEFEPIEELVVNVRRGDTGVRHARVDLVAANAASDRARVLAGRRALLDRQAVPLLPHTRQHTLADADGHARLGAPEHSAWVRVTSPDGELTVVRELRPGQRELSIDLDRPES